MDEWFTPLPVHTPGSDGCRSRKALSRAFAAGEVVRIRHGFYVDTDLWWDANSAQRYATTVKAVAGRLHQPVFTGPTALILHGLPVVETPATIDVLTSTPTRAGVQTTISAYHQGHLRADGDLPYIPRTRQVYVPAPQIAEDLHVPQIHTTVQTQRLPVVLVDTLADLDFCAALPVVDSLLSGRSRDGIHWDRAELAQVLTGRDGTAEHSGLARVLHHATDLSESAGESLSRGRMIELGFELPELQVSMRGADGREYRPDFWWRHLGLIGEFDGWGKYAAPGPDTDVFEALRQEKIREDALRDRGLRVMRWGWEDALDPLRFAELLVRHGVPRRRRASIRWTASSCTSHQPPPATPPSTK